MMKETPKEKEIPTQLTSTTFPLVSTDSGSHPHSLTSLAAVYWNCTPTQSKKLSAEPASHPQWLQSELGHSPHLSKRLLIITSTFWWRVLFPLQLHITQSVGRYLVNVFVHGLV